MALGRESVVPESFGAQLRRYRDAAGLTQEELAERAELTERGLRYLERDLRRPYRATVRRLAASLGLTVEERVRFEAAARQAAAAVPTSFVGERPPLVGRRAELALMERHVRGEGPPVLLLAGEPGIGKSRLLQAAGEQAATRGWTVLHGGCHRRGDATPYAPLLEALQRYLQQQKTSRLAVVLCGCAWLVRLLPELATAPMEALPAWTLSPDQERRLMFAAVQHLLTNVAGPAGTLLVLDDVQWAGSDALALLETLTTAVGRGPVRVLGAYRDTEVPPDAPLAGLLDTLARAHLVTSHVLPPLGPEEVEELLDWALQGLDHDQHHSAARARIVQRTGGIPFFVESCAQALRLDPVGAPRRETVPWDVAQSVRQRVAALPPAARPLLEGAAVAGQALSPALLTAITGLDEEDVLDAVDAAWQGRLLQEEGEGYSFTHDVLRDVVEADLSAARRRVLHRRVAEALEGEGRAAPPLDTLAYHYSRSDVADKAVVFLERAGDQAAARYAYASAARSYREAAERLGQLGRPGDAARLHEKEGRALRRIGHLEAALDALGRAAAGYRVTGDQEAVGCVAAEMGWVHGDRGCPQEGIALLEPLIEDMEALSPSRVVFAVHLALAALLVRGVPRYPAALRAADRAATVARLLGDQRALVEALEFRTIALRGVGQSAAALALAEQVIGLAETHGVPDTQAWMLNVAAFDYLHQGDLQAATRAMARAVPLIEQIGQVLDIAFLMANRGMIAFWAGEWAQARQDGEQALALSRQLGTNWAEPYPLLVLGLVCYGEGDWVTAAALLDQSVAAAERIQERTMLHMASLARAELHLRQGDAASALVRLSPLLTHSTLGQREYGRTRATQAWAWLEQGETAVAVEAATEAVTVLRDTAEHLRLVDALRVQAMALRSQGQAHAAQEALDEALARARSLGCSWSEARVLTIQAELSLRRGERDTARACWEDALVIFRRLGARTEEGILQQEVARRSTAG